MGQRVSLEDIPKATFIPEQESDSLLFKALEYLDRPRAAGFGAVSKLIEGESPLEGLRQGITGEEDFRGKEILEQFGYDPDSLATKGFGIASEFVFDPLNLVGIGGLTKVGRGAKALKTLDPGILTKLGRPLAESARLAEDFGQQAKLGQRALLSFGGKSLQPFESAIGAPVLQGLQNIGRGIRDTNVARHIESKIGGRAGIRRTNPIVFEGQNQQMTDAFDEALKAGDRVANTYNFRVQEYQNTLNKLSLKNKGKSQELLNTIQLLERGDLDIPGLIQQWNTTPGNAAERVLRALDQKGQLSPQVAAIRDDADMRKGFQAWLENVDVERQFRDILEGGAQGQFELGPFGHVPRIPKGKKKGDIKRLDLAEPTDLAVQPPHRNYQTGVVRNQDGTFTTMPVEEKNFLNAGLTPGSVQPVEFGVSGIEKGVSGNPARVTIREANFVDEHGFVQNPRPGFGAISPHTYSENIGKIRAEANRQAAQSLRATRLIDSLVDQGVAAPWDDSIHAASDWVKVTQGKWTQNPIAVPKEINELFTTYAKEGMDPMRGIEMMSSGKGGMLNEFTKWFKLMAISGNFGAFHVRNFASAMVKNFVENLGPGNPQTYRLYGVAANMVGKKGANIRKPIEGVVDLGGVKWDYERIMQEYMIGNFSGGGGLIGQSLANDEAIEVIEGIAKKTAPVQTAAEKRSLIKELREAGDFGETQKALIGKSRQLRETGPVGLVGKATFGANERVELMARLPLMMKSLEDQAAVMRKAGLDVPNVMRPLDNAADALAHDPIVHTMIENAKQLVYKAHFDYTDLSQFEQSNWAKGFLVPFYSWARNNIPHETQQILTKPGKYVGFARAYRNMWEASDIDPEDAPPWLRESFAVPIPDEILDVLNKFSPIDLDTEEDIYLSVQNYLPFMDVVDIVGATVAPTKLGGRDRVERSIREVATQLNPLATELPEQGLDKDFFTGRSITRGGLPKEIAGLAVGPRVAKLLTDVLPPVGVIDRMVGTEIAQGLHKLGVPTIEPGAKRKGRDEPAAIERAIRQLTGLKLFRADDTQANMSARRRKRILTTMRKNERSLRREGRISEANFVRRSIDAIQ